MWDDASQLSRTFDGMSIRNLLDKLSEVEPTVVEQVLFLGLKNYDRAMTLPTCKGLIQGWLDDGNSPVELVGHLVNALEESGVIRAKKVDPNAPKGGDPSTEGPKETPVDQR